LLLHFQFSSAYPPPFHLSLSTSSPFFSFIPLPVFFLFFYKDDLVITHRLSRLCSREYFQQSRILILASSSSSLSMFHVTDLAFFRVFVVGLSSEPPSLRTFCCECINPPGCLNSSALYDVLLLHL
jgi:hypothetical protein